MFREQRSPKDHKEPEKRTKGKREASEEEKDAVPKDDDPPTAIQAVVTKPPPPAPINPTNYKLVSQFFSRALLRPRCLGVLRERRQADPALRSRSAVGGEGKGSSGHRRREAGASLEGRLKTSDPVK